MSNIRRNCSFAGSAHWDHLHITFFNDPFYSDHSALLLWTLQNKLPSNTAHNIQLQNPIWMSLTYFADCGESSLPGSHCQSSIHHNVLCINWELWKNIDSSIAHINSLTLEPVAVINFLERIKWKSQQMIERAAKVSTWTFSWLNLDDKFCFSSLCCWELTLESLHK